jgi:hypothetical protein
MKFSRHTAFVAAFLFLLGGYGCDSLQPAEEVVEACEAVCDRLDFCETPLLKYDPADILNDPTVEVDCFATCDDLDDLESEISQSCKDAITTVFECTESLNCNVVENFDFTRQGRILLNTSPGNDNLNNKVFTSPPQHFVEAYNSCEGTAEECDGHFAASCGLARNARDYDYCPVNTNCIRCNVFGLPLPNRGRPQCPDPQRNPPETWGACSISGFDMITMLVDDCATEYIAMAEECRGEPKF